MNEYNSTKLSSELRAAGITTHGNCNSNGVVLDEANEHDISKRPDVKAIIDAHDPTPDAPAKTDNEEIAELKAKVAILSKTADKSGLTMEELSVLGEVM